MRGRGICMIVRNELNEALYRQKMDDFRITEPFPKPPQLAAISEGRSETIRAMLGQGELSLDSDGGDVHGLFGEDGGDPQGIRYLAPCTEMH